MDIEDFYTPRKLMFKAWNVKTGLLMRLNSIDCIKGELQKKNHILLQFTGRQDSQGEDVYEMDILLIGSEKFMVTWREEPSGWFASKLSETSVHQPLSVSLAQRATRLCSRFESEKD